MRAAGCAAIIVLGGCGKSSDIGKVVPVSGAVKVDDKPVTGGTLAFAPDAGKGNTSLHTAAAEIDGSGNYTLFTAGKSGAVPGWYRVSVTEKEEVDSTKPEVKSKLNKKYSNSEKSGLSVQVVENAAAGAYDLKLTLK